MNDNMKKVYVLVLFSDMDGERDVQILGTYKKEEDAQAALAKQILYEHTHSWLKDACFADLNVCEEHLNSAVYDSGYGCYTELWINEQEIL